MSSLPTSTSLRRICHAVGCKLEEDLVSKDSVGEEMSAVSIVWASYQWVMFENNEETSAVSVCGQVTRG